MVLISHRALQGSRGHRLAVGVMLFLFWAFMAVGLTAAAITSRVGWSARLGLGAGALSAYLLVWWSARFWWSAFCQGRREEAVAEPDAWPWLFPPVIGGVALAVSGVGMLSRGDGSGWFGVGLALVLAGPSLMMMILQVGEWFSGRSRRTPVVPTRPVEPPRPRRDWGSIGR
ncbi:hypothetical protein ABTY20_09955 [Streptomyces sp. NPDC126497]|uniref:hypothetical protein n=1 Tax=Streptomyces sp. NPDC126497 TaxID=3155313 RepID=UPI0033285047